jgi:hypothetical protein
MDEISDDAQEQHFGTRLGEIVVHGDAPPCSRSPQVRVCRFIYTPYRDVVRSAIHAYPGRNGY